MSRPTAPYQPAPRPPRTSRAGPRALTFVGIALLVVAVTTVVGGSLLAAHGVISLGRTAKSTNDIITNNITLQPGQTTTVTLEAHASNEMTLYVLDTTPPVVTGPDGSAVTVTLLHRGTSEGVLPGPISLAGPATDWTFTSQEAGPYQITVDTDDSVLLTRGIGRDTVVGGAAGTALTVGGVILLVVAGVGAAVGLGLTVGGGLWWSARARNARRAAITTEYLLSGGG